MTNTDHASGSGPALCRSQAEGPPAEWERTGLPAWAYTSEELFEIEKDVLFRRHWQLAGHVGNAPGPGDYFCFDMAGERAVIIRGRDNELRAFHNVCRHRGSRVVADETGSCRSAIVCPFHGWSYNLDGTFRTTPSPKSLPPLDPVQHGLLPLEFEIWHGFVFVRFLPGPQPAVEEIMRRHEREIAPYLAGRAEACGAFSSEQIEANWKCVRDVDNEGYHVPMAHPGLMDLYGKGYFDENWQAGTSRSFAPFDDGDGRLWSVRHYKKLLPEVSHLPQSHRNAWLYIGMFPNIVLYFYPDGLGFYQDLPVSAARTRLRSCAYVVPESGNGASPDNRYRRRMRAARYLADRIDNITSAEDIQLTMWSNEACRSSGYRGFILSDLEYGVRGHHDQMRELIPELNSDEVPDWASPRTS